MCHQLAWFRFGDSVCIIQDGETGAVIGLHCDSCGGWRDDHERVGEDQVVDLVGYRVRARGDSAPARNSVQAGDPPAGRTR